MINYFFKLIAASRGFCVLFARVSCFRFLSRQSQAMLRDDCDDLDIRFFTRHCFIMVFRGATKTQSLKIVWSAFRGLREFPV